MIKTLKTKTAKGGWKHPVATSWNSKLTTKRAKPKVAKFVPVEVLHREVNAAYHAFWAKRRVQPDATY